MSFIFEIGQINYGATLSLRAYRWRAQDSEVMVVALLKFGHYPNYYCRSSFYCHLFRNTPNYGATLSLRAYRRRGQDSEVMVVSLLKCRSFIQIIIVGNFCSVIYF